MVINSEPDEAPQPSHQSPEPQPPREPQGAREGIGPGGYAVISFIGLAIAIAMLFVLINWSSELREIGSIGRAYYLLLVPLGLGAASFLFGAMRSYATYKGRHFGGYLELGGPVVAAALVVLGGFWLVPTEETFSVTIRVHGPGGIQDFIETGRVFVDLGRDRRWVDISAQGEAELKEIPARFKGEAAIIGVEVTGFTTQDEEKRYTLSDEVIYVELDKEPLILGGRVVEVGTGEPVEGARIVVLGPHQGESVSDSNGAFRFQVEGEGLAGDRVDVEILHSDYRQFRGGVTLSDGNLLPLTPKR